MGLDVSLYRNDNLKESKRKEELYEKFTDTLGEKDKEYDAYTEEEKDEIHRKSLEYATSLGLDKFGGDPNEISIELNSEKYPEHMFKIGYFRSSYNSGGINHILEDRLGISLYDLFDVQHDQSDVIPDWNKAKVKTEKAIADFRKYLDENGDFQIMQSRYNELSGTPDKHPIKDENDALKVFNEAYKRYKKEKAENPNEKVEGYSNGGGEFHFEDELKLVGIIPGVQKRFFVDEYIPCTFLVYETKGDGMTWYLNALEIVLETIEFVLKQPDPTIYYMYWSG